jgi:hypothetical protein
LSGNATTATTATTATNIAGGAAWSIPYQSDVAKTGFLQIASTNANQVLAVNNTGTAFGWTTISSSTTLTNKNLGSTDTTTFYLSFVAPTSTGATSFTTSSLNYSDGTITGGSTNKLSYVPGSGTLTSTIFNAASDYRIKDNITNLDETFSVDNLRPVTYFNKSAGKTDIGFIAHEVQEEFPYLVVGEKDGEQMQSLNYNGLIGILVKEIQELKKRVKELENKSV